uniref:Ig-like domain-containing protein n=1 Tax=Heterorhabditis bacteriophora TaxID=37862 RepID=A0A1I7X6Z1_HETBA
MLFCTIYDLKHTHCEEGATVNWYADDESETNSVLRDITTATYITKKNRRLIYNDGTPVYCMN